MALEWELGSLAAKSKRLTLSRQGRVTLGAGVTKEGQIMTIKCNPFVFAERDSFRHLHDSKSYQHLPVINKKKIHRN